MPVGGHNLLEAAAAGVPVMFGPYMANFKDIATGVLSRKAAIECRTPQDVVAAIQSLHSDAGNRAELVQRARAFLQENRGAIAAITALIEAEMATA